MSLSGIHTSLGSLAHVHSCVPKCCSSRSPLGGVPFSGAASSSALYLFLTDVIFLAPSHPSLSHAVVFVCWQEKKPETMAATPVPSPSCYVWSDYGFGVLFQPGQCSFFGGAPVISQAVVSLKCRWEGWQKWERCCSDGKVRRSGGRGGWVLLAYTGAFLPRTCYLYGTRTTHSLHACYISQVPACCNGGSGQVHVYTWLRQPTELLICFRVAQWSSGITGTVCGVLGHLVGRLVYSGQ